MAAEVSGNGSAPSTDSALSDRRGSARTGHRAKPGNRIAGVFCRTPTQPVCPRRAPAHYLSRGLSRGAAAVFIELLGRQSPQKAPRGHTSSHQGRSALPESGTSRVFLGQSQSP